MVLQLAFDVPDERTALFWERDIPAICENVESWKENISSREKIMKQMQ